MTAPTPIPCEGGCGRLLRTPDSIRRRHGPVCWEKANPTRGRGHSRIRARRPKPTPPATGQLTLFEETTTMTDPSTPTTHADEVWAECAASVARLNPGMSTRNVLVHGLESFAESWATTWEFSLHDPNDVKELARWLRNHLDGRKAGCPNCPEGYDCSAGNYYTGAVVPPLRPAVPTTAMHLPGPDGRCTISCNHGPDTVYGGGGGGAPSGTTGMTTPAPAPTGPLTCDAVITDDLYDVHNRTHVGKPLTPDCAYCDAIKSTIPSHFGHGMGGGGFGG